MLTTLVFLPGVEQVVVLCMQHVCTVGRLGDGKRRERMSQGRATAVCIQPFVLGISFCFFQKNLTQDDPHWRISLDDQSDGFQRPK